MNTHPLSSCCKAPVKYVSNPRKEDDINLHCTSCGKPCTINASAVEEEIVKGLEGMKSVVDDTNRIERFSDYLSQLPDNNIMKSDGAYLIRACLASNKRFDDALALITKKI